MVLHGVSGLHLRRGKRLRGLLLLLLLELLVGKNLRLTLIRSLLQLLWGWRLLTCGGFGGEAQRWLWGRHGLWRLRELGLLLLRDLLELADAHAA